ncbi:MAG: family 10 glycosylhydrolase [Bacteroidota bacterium]
MNRRYALKKIGQAGLATAASKLLLFEDDFAIRGQHYVWLHGNKDKSEQDWNALFARIKQAGFKGILINAGVKLLNKVIPIAKAQSLEVHAWMWTLNQPGEKQLQAEKPELYSISREGKSVLDAPPYVGYYRWLCPSRAGTLDFLHQKVASLLAVEGLDGVHLDYVRYCDVILPRALWEKYDLVQKEELPPYDYCYCTQCREKFAESSGLDPAKMEDPSSSEAWKQYRYDRVTQIVNSLSDQVHAENSLLSAAVFPYPDLARKLVRQSWDDWRLDKVFPMIYHSFYNEGLNWIKRSTASGVNDIANRFTLHTGLYMPALKKMNHLQKAVQRSRQGGAEGIAIFNGDNLAEEYWEHLQDALW